MKRILTIAIALLVLAPLARAEDQSKSRKKAKKERTEAVSNRSNKEKTEQAEKARANATAANNSEREKNRNRGEATRRENQTTAQNRSKVANKNRTEAERRENQRSAQNKNRAVKRDVRSGRTGQRRFVISGNHMSFSDARRFNWRQRHDRSWWRSQNYRFVRYGGGYWFWNNGWWFPAYGYDPYYSTYVYDGPIFGYGYAAPGEVTIEVQRALADYGYYRGPADGILGPMTRLAIERYQADRGLAVTATIDERTLLSLGLA